MLTWATEQHSWKESSFLLTPPLLYLLLVLSLMPPSTADPET